MAESKKDKMIRLRQQADAADERGRSIMEIFALFADEGQYEEARVEAQALAAQAAALRDHADRLEKTIKKTKENTKGL